MTTPRPPRLSPDGAADADRATADAIAARERAGAVLYFTSQRDRASDRATDLLADAANGLQRVMADMGRYPGRSYTDWLTRIADELHRAATARAEFEVLRAVEGVTK